MAESKPPENQSRSSQASASSEQSANSGRTSDTGSKKSVPGFSTSIPDLSGRNLGDFCLLRKLGRGGMAEVYLAEQTSLRRQVAIKIMRSEFVADPVYVKRFRHEASAAGGLNHPNIVQVYMVGEVDGIHFISQEYVQGRNLKEFITRKGPLEVPIALHILKQVAAALQVAHEKGIVHRDIKPENILLNRKGEAKVADFGLAQLTLGGERVTMTQEGVTMGTPLYMSPEQVNGKPLDARSDIYSLGIMAWHMLAGHPPFSGDTALAVAVKHLNEAPPSLTTVREDVPVGVRTMIERMMSKKKEDRPADALAVFNECKQLIRQLTNKESPTIETAFQPKRPDRKLAVNPLQKPLSVQAGWLFTACIIAAVGSASVGWAMRTTDPLKTPVKQLHSVPGMSSIEGQFLYAQGDPTNEAAWYEALVKIGDDAQHVRMKDQCELNLAMIYARTRRIDKARDIFTKFELSDDSWRKAQGLAGDLVLEDLKGRDADSIEIRRKIELVIQHLHTAASKSNEGRDGRLEEVIDTAFRDVVRRHEAPPK